MRTLKLHKGKKKYEFSFRHILPGILAYLTGIPRYEVKVGRDFNWSKDLWVHNIYRTWELIFWERGASKRIGDRIKPSFALTLDGKYRVFFTVEAALAHAEGTLRQAIRNVKLPTIQKVYLPQFAPAGLGNFGVNSPYLFAIGAPTKNDANLTNNGDFWTSGTGVTINPSGSNLYCGVHMQTNDIGGSVTQVQFNGAQNFTLIKAEAAYAGGGSVPYAWYLCNISATSANVVATGSGISASVNGTMVVYTGVNQSITYGPAANDNVGSDNWNSAIGTGTSNYTRSVTTIADNSWTWSGAGNTGVVQTVGSGSSARHSNGASDNFIDSGSAITPAASKAMNWSNSSATYYIFAVSFSPQTAVSISVTDSITLGEVVSRFLTSFISKTDAVTLGESLSMLMFSSISVSDAITLSETRTMSATLAGISVTDSVALGEVLTMQMTSFINTTDGLTLGETLATAYVSTINVSDSISLTDIATVFIPTLPIAVLDSISIGEVKTVTNSNLGDISISDSIAIGEVVTMSLAIPGISVSDAISISEVRTLSVGVSISVTDAIAIGETRTLIRPDLAAGIAKMCGNEDAYPLGMDDNAIL